MFRAVVGVGMAVGIVVGFEPVWGGRFLDFVFLQWPGPVGLLTLAALAAAIWRGVRHGAWQASHYRLVALATALSIAVGGALGFLGSLAWLKYLVVPARPGHIGYLPFWPWQAVSWELTARLIPAIIVLALWSLGAAYAAARRTSSVSALNT